MRSLLAAAAVLAFAAPLLAQPNASPAAGAQAYGKRCASCHGPQGAGTPGVVPPLLGAKGLARTEAGRDYLAAVLGAGLIGPIEVGGKRYAGAMPGLGSAVPAAEKAAILNHVLALQPGGPAPAPFTPAEIEARQAKAPRSPAMVAKARPAGAGR